MNNFTRYIDALRLVYKDGYYSIVDKNNNFIYVTEKLAKLIGLPASYVSLPIEEIRGDFAGAVKQLKLLNDKVLSSCKSVKFSLAGRFNADTYLFSHGAKYPVLDDMGEAIGVFTLLNPAKIIGFEALDVLTNQRVGDHIAFNIESEYNLSEIEQQILFYYNIGFTQSESYQCIKSYCANKLPYNTFKSYQFKLLKKFNVPNIESLREMVDELKGNRFIPKNLINNRILMTSYDG